MVSGSKFKYFIGKLFRGLLLILFLGYYSSVTFFTHSHIINGVTIVHSHPFNSDKGNNTLPSSHSEKELVVIQLLSEFFTTVFIFSFTILVLRALLYRIPAIPTKNGYAEPGGYCTSPLRAPPFEIIQFV